MKKIVYMLLFIACIQLYGMEGSKHVSFERLVIDNSSGQAMTGLASHNPPEEIMYERTQNLPIEQSSSSFGGFIYDQATGGTPTQRNSLGKAFRWVGKITGNAAVAQELIGLGKKEEGTATKQIYKKVDALLDADLNIEKKLIDSYVLRMYWATSTALELHNELVDFRINEENRPAQLVPLIEKASRILTYSTSAENNTLKYSILPPKIVESLNREISHASKRMQRKE